MKETLSDAYLYRQSWTVIHFTEIRDLMKEGIQIQNKLKELKLICDKANNAINSKCTKQVAIKLLDERFKSVITLQHDLVETHSRKKRGLFNVVGEFHKILWGSLSNSDLEYFNQEIDRLYNHSNTAILLNKEAVHITQDVLETIKNDCQIYNKNVNKINDWVESMIKEIDHIEANDLLTEAIVELEITIDDYRNLLKSYIDGILHAWNGHLLTTLMPVEVLINSLNEIQKSQPFIVPTFEITKPNYPLITKVIEIIVYLNNTRLVSILRVLIAANELFSAVKYTSLPQHVGKQSFRLFLIPDSVLFISKDSSHYSIERNHLHHCKKGFKSY